MGPFWFGGGLFGEGQQPEPITDAERLASQAEYEAIRHDTIDWLVRNWPWIAVVILLASVGLRLVV